MMIKKIFSLMVAGLLLSATVFASVTTPLLLAQASEEITGETKTYVLFATADGAFAGKGNYSAINGVYESMRFYTSDESDGGIATSNTTSPFTFALGQQAVEGKDAQFAGLFRFPINLLNLPANESVVQASLKLTSRYNKEYSVGDGFDIKAYGGFTNATYGEAIPEDGDKTFAEITAAEALAGGTTVTADLSSLTPVYIDVTPYVAGAVSAGSSSADLAVAAPSETTACEFMSGASNYGATNSDDKKYAPMLIITTEVDPNYGLPEIDTASNEGKTKIRMQTQSEVAFANDSCGITQGTNADTTFTVKAKTAGKYYFGVYSVTRTAAESTVGRKGSLIVNGTTVASADDLYKLNRVASYTTDAVVPADIAKSVYLTVFEVDLIAGKNTIKIDSGSSQLGFAYVELTNYARADVGAESRNISEKGIEILAANQPDLSVTVLPAVSYKVYDSIADVPSSIAKGNVTMQLSGEGNAVDSVSYIAASYDDNGYIKEIKVIKLPLGKRATKNVDFGEFNLSGIDYIKVFAFDASSPAPIAASYGKID